MPEGLFTIGHSNRSYQEFVALLRGVGVVHVADIRSHPRSRHNPQFDQDLLRSALAGDQIRYTWLPELGGRRASFRKFMRTDEFDRGLQALLALPGPLAFMCAEATPESCHRFLVADAVLAASRTVLHIVDPDGTRPHRMTPHAVVVDRQVCYPVQTDLFASGGE